MAFSRVRAARRSAVSGGDYFFLYNLSGKEQPVKLPELFDISRATIRTIRQNLTWALFYNLVSIPIAALGVLHPSICATAMSASSIGVLMHSLRLKDSGKKERRFPWKKKS